MFTQLLMALQRVRIVSTTAELEAVQRLRYQIYVEEGGDLEHYEADHSTKRIISEVDTAPETRTYYTGAVGQPKATIRLQSWAAGELPEAFQELYSTKLLPPLDHLVISETSGLVALPTKRGSLSVLGLVAQSVYHSITETGTNLSFSTCVPGLLRKYKKLGYRSYGGRPISTTSGILLPIVCLLDEEHFRAVRSPLLSVFDRLKREGHLPSTEGLGELERVLSGSGSLESEQQAIAEDLEASLQGGTPNRLRELLSPKLFRYLISNGVAIEVESGVEVVQQNANDQDLFLILEGTLDVFVDDQYRATLVEGECFGEVALLSDDARRLASVRTSSPSRLMVVRRSTLARLERESPSEALQIYKALVSLLARWAVEQQRG